MPPTVTLAFVDTSSHVLTRAALEASVTQFPFTRVLVATDRPEAFPGYDTVRVDPFPTIREFCRYLTHGLVEHITTDVMLMAQYDGFVIHGDQYSPHFAHYDYIGAPWPMFEDCAVGNGGFSWRSRRLMEAVATLDYDGVEPEDIFICRTSRILLESRHKVRFPGRDLASHFSQELSPRHYPSFGFHGFFHLPTLYAKRLDFLVENLTPRMLRNSNAAPMFAQQLGRLSPQVLHRFEQRRREAEAAEARAAAAGQAGAR